MAFKNNTVIITGASRGIGKAIGLRLAKEGANIVIASKSVEENPKLGGTIFSAAKEMEAAGGRALAVQCDIRNEEQHSAVLMYWLTMLLRSTSLLLKIQNPSGSTLCMISM